MLQVNVDKILPVTEARDKFNQLIDGVEGTDELYVLTKNGKPAAVLVGVNHLEKLTGETNIHTMAAAAMPDDSLASDEETNQPDDSQTETVFASADDALTDNTAAVATEDNTPLDITQPTPAPTTETQGTVAEVSPAPATLENDPIQPVPEDFGSNMPSEPVPAPTASEATPEPTFTIPPNEETPSPNEAASENIEEDSEPPIDPFSNNAQNPASEDSGDSGDFSSNTISGK